MARINIEDSVFADGRYLILKGMVGEEMAIGKLVVAWKTAQQFWLQDKLIPTRFWQLLKLDELIEVGFAEIRDDGVYVCGTEEHFDWLKQKQEAGRKSGESRKAKKLKEELSENERNANEKGTHVQSRSNETSTENEPLPPSLPPTLINNIPQSDFDEAEQEDVFDFISIYKNYPRKQGKTKGIQNLEKKIKTREKYEQLKIAVNNYANESVGIEKKFIKHFDTFSNCWEDYLEVEKKALIDFTEDEAADYFEQRLADV